MAAVKVSESVELNVAPSRLWAAMADQKLLPTLLPEHFKTIELPDGTWAPGSTRIVHFGPAISSVTGNEYVKEKLESVDEASRTVTIATVEGAGLGKLLSTSTATSALANGKDENSTLAALSLEYVPISAEASAVVQSLKQGTINVLKVVEAHLQSNPTAYA